VRLPSWRWLRGALLLPLLSVILGFAVGGVAVYASGASPFDAYAALFQGAFTNTNALPETLVTTTPYILLGLALAVGFRAGLFNIGAQGQMIVGALAAAVIGAHLALPAGLHPLAALVGAAAAGAAYGFIPAVLKLRRGVHEVISTIMLNWIAVGVVENWLVVGPLRATAHGTASASGTDEILSSAELPRLLGDASRLNVGFPLALAVAFAVWAWLARSRDGFEVRAVGLGAEAARAAGIPVARRTCEAMALAGGLAGLAGAVLVLGTEYKFPATLGAPYGFDGIAIALIGQNHPLGVGVAAILFGALRAGGTRMQLLGVHKSFPELIQGLALLFVAGRVGWELMRRWRGRHLRAEGVEVPRA
jgi:simple sugar transport system permease protein